MAVSGNQIAFAKVPESFSNISILGGLVCDMRDMLGPRGVVDLSDITAHQLLARDCIATLCDLASPARMASEFSLGGYGGAIRTLLKYCTAAGLPDDLRMKNINSEFLLEFKRFLRLTRPEHKTDSLRRTYGNLWRLLQVGQDIGLAHTDLEPPRNFRWANDSDTTQPYTAGEALDIEDVCRNHIRALLTRLEKGNELLLQGKDPRGKPAKDPVTGRIVKQPFAQRAWNQLPNLLWYVVNVMDGKFVKYAGRGEVGHSSFNNATSSCWGKFYSKEDVFAHLYPLTEDLIPFIILLAKYTGRNESSILKLRRDCLQEVNGRYVLWYRKERGGSRLYRKIISNDGPFSPAELIRTLHQITEPLVCHAAPDSQDDLLLGLTVHGHGLNPVKSLDPSYIKFQMNRDGGWCDQNELLDAHGRAIRISLRRLRVYYLTKRYKSHGQLGKISRDAAHTLSQTTVGYVNNDSTKHIHERAIEAGIKAARSLARPIVLSNDSTAVAVEALSVSEQVAEKVLRGEQDVFFASCKDFYNRPGGSPNSPCDKPWGCLLCANAIITRHVLPRVLAFMHFMDRQRFELSQEDWVMKFGSPWQVLTKDVLPKFSAETLAEAQRHVRDESFYIPLALKV